jgi:hypothetical protein
MKDFLFGWSLEKLVKDITEILHKKCMLPYVYSYNRWRTLQKTQSKEK